MEHPFILFINMLKNYIAGSLKPCFKKQGLGWVVVLSHDYNPSTWAAEAGSLRVKDFNL